MASGDPRRPRLTNTRRRHSDGVPVPPFLRSYSDFPDDEKITELNFENCYGDDLSEFCNAWAPSLPDYPNSRQGEITAASDNNSRNYVASLQSNFRLNKPRNIHKPSFVNGPPDTLESSDQREVRNRGPPVPVARDNQPGQGLQTVGAQDCTDVPTQKKSTVVDQLVESVEKAIKSGNTAFVRGPIHPLQGNIGLLQMNRRSGYSNNFTTEDYMANMPHDYVPIASPWEEKIIFTFM